MRSFVKSARAHTGTT